VKTPSFLRKLVCLVTTIISEWGCFYYIYSKT